MKFKVRYPYTSYREIIIEAVDEDDAFNKVWSLPQTQEDGPDGDDIEVRRTR